MKMPAPGERLDRLDRRARSRRRDCSAAARSATTACITAPYDATQSPPAVQTAAPPRVRRWQGRSAVAASSRAHADGWNTCWVVDARRVPRAARRARRRVRARRSRPATVWRTLGLYALCGENERDLERSVSSGCGRSSPAGVLDGVDLATFRKGRLVGTVDEVREQVAGGMQLGVDTIILGVGAVPFQVGALDDVELLLHADDCVLTSDARECAGSAGGVGEEVATATQDAAAFAFGCATPDAVLDAVLQRVLEAFGSHRQPRRRAARLRRPCRRTGRTRWGSRHGRGRGASTRTPQESRPRSPPSPRTYVSNMSTGSTHRPVLLLRIGCGFRFTYWLDV